MPEVCYGAAPTGAPFALRALEAASKTKAPRWIYPVVVTALVVAAITFVTYRVVVPGAGALVQLAGVALAGASIVFLALTALSDPGVFKRQPRPLAPDWT